MEESLTSYNINKYTWKVEPAYTWKYSDTFFIKNINIAFSLAIRKNSLCAVSVKLIKYPTNLGKADAQLDFGPDNQAYDLEEFTFTTEKWEKDWKIIERFEFEETNRLTSTAINSWTIKCVIMWHGFAEIPTKTYLCNHMSAGFSMIEEASDVTISIDNEEIPAHSAILAFQSRKFFEMLNLNTTQKNKQLKIVDVNIKVMKQLLTLMYTGELLEEEGVEGWFQILAAANTYQLDHLKKRCEIELYNLLTVNNVLNILEAASLHNAKQLHQDAIDFIIHNFKIIVKMDFFKKLYAEKPGIFPDMTNIFSYYSLTDL